MSRFVFAGNEIIPGTVNLGKDNLILDSDYSTEEKPTGATWIDGKPIYRKSWDIPGSALVRGTNNYRVEDYYSITGLWDIIDDIVSTSGMIEWTNGTTQWKTPLFAHGVTPGTTLSFQFGSSFNLNSNNCTVEFFFNSSNFSPSLTTTNRIVLTLEYTKTTD